MFRCAGFFLVLASLFFTQQVLGDPLDAYGYIQGVVKDTDGDPLHRVAMETVAHDTIVVNDQTDERGRYSLAVPLFVEDSIEVNVKSSKFKYIPDSTNVWAVFGRMTLLNFELACAAGPIRGTITDTQFGEPIESVFVYVAPDTAKSTYSDALGDYNLRIYDPNDYTICFTHRDFIPDTSDTEAVCYEDYQINSVLERVIWHVAEVADDDTLRGSRKYPFDRIQDAINLATTDDTVLVGPGTYLGTEGNNDITLNGSNGPRIAVISEMGPESTIIDCEANQEYQHRGFILDDDPGSTVAGFTITNAYHTDGAGMWIKTGSTSIIDRCIFTGNIATQSGAAIAVERSSPTVKNCIISDNIAELSGGGIYIYRQSDLQTQIENCTIVRNLSAEGGGAFCESTEPHPIINRCIFWGNIDDLPGESSDQIGTLNSEPIVTYCNVQGEPVWPGLENMNYHPLFCDYKEGDFSLGLNSPCADWPIGSGYIGALGKACDSVSVIYGWVTDLVSLDSIPDVIVEAVCDLSPTETDTTDQYGYYELVIITGGTDTADVTFSHLSYGDSTVVDTQFTIGYSTRLDMVWETSDECLYVAGDSDENGVARELTDVVKMIAYYRGFDEPGYVCFCTPENPEYQPAADPDGNCTPYELTDVVKSIAAYRGPEPLSGCVDCPGS